MKRILSWTFEAPGAWMTGACARAWAPVPDAPQRFRCTVHGYRGGWSWGVDDTQDEYEGKHWWGHAEDEAAAKATCERLVNLLLSLKAFDD